MDVHICNPSTRRRRQEDHSFKDSPYYKFQYSLAASKILSFKIIHKTKCLSELEVGYFQFSFL